MSQQPPIEISCGTFTLEMLHEHYKHILGCELFMMLIVYLKKIEKIALSLDDRMFENWVLEIRRKTIVVGY